MESCVALLTASVYQEMKALATFLSLSHRYDHHRASSISLSEPSVLPAPQLLQDSAALPESDGPLCQVLTPDCKRAQLTFGSLLPDRGRLEARGEQIN